MILDWEKVSQNIKNDLVSFCSWLKNKYIVIFLLSDDFPSFRYVTNKKKFGESLGLPVVVLGNENFDLNQKVQDEEINYLKKLDYTEKDNVFYAIQKLNQNSNCIWIMVQLPLNQGLKNFKLDILTSVDSKKDIDCLNGKLLWYSAIGYTDILPATPQAVINILRFYNLFDMKGKNVSIIWQSDLVGKPLALEFIKKWAEVFSFNRFSNLDSMKRICKDSDYIISATWFANLINSEFVVDNKSQIIIDVWYTKKWTKIYGDADFDKIKDKVKAITPVPGWVGPVTVASLFQNIQKLYIWNFFKN